MNSNHILMTCLFLLIVINCEFAGQSTVCAQRWCASGRWVPQVRSRDLAAA
jgi:hypothetical protein